MRDTTIYSLNVPILGRWCHFFDVRRNLHGPSIDGIQGSFGQRLDGKVKILDMLLIVWSCRRWYVFWGVSVTTSASEVPSDLWTSSPIRYNVLCGHDWSPSPFPIFFRAIHCNILVVPYLPALLA